MDIEIKITGEKKVFNKWTLATAEVNGRKYDIQMVRFENPSSHGIRRCRISKLWVCNGRPSDSTNYDRGWDHRPISDEGKAVLEAIIKRDN